MEGSYVQNRECSETPRAGAEMIRTVPGHKVRANATLDNRVGFGLRAGVKIYPAPGDCCAVNGILAIERWI